MGMSQNIAMVNANTAELANGLGVPPNIPEPSAPPGTTEAQQAGEQGSQQAMQMVGQMASMAAQLPGQIAGMITQAPQALMQPLQQLAQPLQSLTSMFGGNGSSSGSATPFSSFSNHPLAGGAGAGGGAGMVRAASTPGSGGLPAQTPLMANLVGSSPGTGGPVPEAGTSAVGGLAPVGAGGGMGGAPLMGQRGEGSSGAAASLAAPARLEYDLGEGVDDDW